VRQLTSWGLAPAKGPLVASGASVAATRADGTTVSVDATAGVFALPAVARGSDGAWLRVSRNGTIRTLAWLDTSRGDATGVELPLFDEALPQSTATAVSVPALVAGKGTLVLRVVDATGTPIAGVTTTRVNYLSPGLGFFGPYYDDNADGVTSVNAGTGTKGTLIYLAVDPAVASLGFDVPISIPKSGNATLSFRAAADAVSYRVVATP
jgi:hypothetical protein